MLLLLASAALLFNDFEVEVASSLACHQLSRGLKENDDRRARPDLHFISYVGDDVIETL